MKKMFLKSVMLLLISGLIFTSCKKDKEDPDDTAAQTAAASDESSFQTESDGTVEDMDKLFTSENMRTDGTLPCGGEYTLDSAAGAYIVTYNNTPSCDGKRNRTGVISVKLVSGTRWQDYGAKMAITMINFTVARIADGKSITINGTRNITNVNGGYLKNLTSGQNIVHKIRANNSIIKFEDGTTRIWSEARTRTFSVGADTTVTLAGDTSISGHAKTAVWGVGRNGNPFYSLISSPVVAKKCSAKWKIVSGVKVHKGLVREITVTYGVDQSGNAANNCDAYGYRVNWTNLKGESKQAVISY